MIQSLTKNRLTFPQKLDVSTKSTKPIPLLGIFPKISTSYYRENCPSIFTGVLTNSQEMESTWTSFNRRIDHEKVVHLQNGILFNFSEIRNN